MLSLIGAFALLAAAPAQSASPPAPASPPSPVPPSPPAAPGLRADDVLSRMFVWWNAAFKEPNGFTPEAFGRFFTEDAVMRINGTNRAKGLVDLAARFRKIQGSVDAVEIQVPFLEVFASADGSKLFTYHLERSMKDGKPSRSMVMGYAELRGGRIALINFLSMEGQPRPKAPR